MEMEFKDPARRRRFVLLLVGGVLAAVAGFAAFTMAGSGKPETTVITDSVLVAARDIPARQQIGPDDVTVRQVPIDEVLSQSYKEAAMVVGRLTAVPVYADQQITPN